MNVEKQNEKISRIMQMIKVNKGTHSEGRNYKILGTLSYSAHVPTKLTR